MQIQIQGQNLDSNLTNEGFYDLDEHDSADCWKQSCSLLARVLQCSIQFVFITQHMLMIKLCSLLVYMMKTVHWLRLVSPIMLVTKPRKWLHLLSWKQRSIKKIHTKNSSWKSQLRKKVLEKKTKRKRSPTCPTVLEWGRKCPFLL